MTTTLPADADIPVFVPVYVPLTFAADLGVVYAPYIDPEPPFTTGAAYRLEIRTLATPQPGADDPYSVYAPTPTPYASTPPVPAAPADSLLIYSAAAQSPDPDQPTWTLTPDSTTAFATLIATASPPGPAAYDATATHGATPVSVRGAYQVIARGYPIQDPPATEPVDLLVRYGPLTLLLPAPSAGRIPFTGNHAQGCGCGCGGGGSAGQPTPPVTPTDPCENCEDAVLVHGDQYIEGQKDFAEMPTVQGVPISAWATIWFTGEGAPQEPFPGDLNDLYLDRESGNYYRLPDRPQVDPPTPDLDTDDPPTLPIPPTPPATPAPKVQRLAPGPNPQS